MPKRKQPDDETSGNILLKEGPLTEGPLENEYENLDDDDDDDDELDEDGVSRAAKLKKDEYEEIMLAQQPSTLTRDGGIKFTPFNLTEELEDGEFDKAGNFIFKNKEDDEEREGGNDTWAESVNWDEVERKQKERNHLPDDDDTKSEKDTRMVEERDEFTCYRGMLRIMRSDETVQKTIRRLGNDIPRRRPFNKNKKKSDQNEPQSSGTRDKASIEETKYKLDLMTELAHQRFEDGDLDIYEKTYEALEEAINR